MNNGGDSRNREIPGALVGNESGSKTCSIRSDAAPAPEPAGWAVMVLGAGAAGALLRADRRRRYARV